MKRLRFLLPCMLLLCTSMWAQTYSFETINYPGDIFTQLLGINNSFLIAGYHNFAQNSGFTLQPTGTGGGNFVTENFPAAMQTQVIGVTNGGITDGFYIDQQGNTHGFYKRGHIYSTVDFPGTPFNQLLGQNDQNQAAGYYSNSPNNSTPDFPYVYDEKGGVFQVIVIPGAPGGAQATGVNNSQQICGFYIDAQGVNHGFLLNFGTFTKLDFPGSTFTQALGLNNSGMIVGVYMDAQAKTHGFVYTRAGGYFVSVDDPNGVGSTVVNGINDLGVLVGFYGTPPTNSGFVAYPH